MTTELPNTRSDVFTDHVQIFDVLTAGNNVTNICLLMKTALGGIRHLWQN